jgi:hypothetical protein
LHGLHEQRARRAALQVRNAASVAVAANRTAAEDNEIRRSLTRLPLLRLEITVFRGRDLRISEGFGAFGLQNGV